MHRISLYYPEAPSGTADFFQHGTDLPAMVYADAAGATALSSVTLSGTGRKNVYVEDRVDVRVRTSASVIVDEFTEGMRDAAVLLESPSFTGTLADGSQGANGLVDLQTALALWKTSAGARDFKVRRRSASIDETLVDALSAIQSVNQPWFNVATYGAVGDNTTDSYPAFVAAYNACVAAGGGVVYIPAASAQYYLTQTFSVASPRVSIMGDGADVSVVRSGASSGAAISFNCGASTYTGQFVRNIGIASSGAVIGLQLAACPGMVVDTCEIVAAAAYAVSATTPITISGGVQESAHVNGSVYIGSGGTGNVVRGADVRNTVNNGGATTLGASGIRIAAASFCTVTDCRISTAETSSQTANYTNGFGGIFITGASSARVQGCTISTSNTAPGIALDSWVSVRETDNNFTNASANDVAASASSTAELYRGSRLSRVTTASSPATYSPSGNYDTHIITSTGAITTFTPPSGATGHGGRLIIVFKNTSGGSITPTFQTLAGGYSSTGMIVPAGQAGRAEFIYDASRSATTPWLQVAAALMAA